MIKHQSTPSCLYWTRKRHYVSEDDDDDDDDADWYRPNVSWQCYQL